MEENQSQNNKRNSHSNLSVTMSFILAFVAIISLVAYGFGQVSFAIPEEQTTNFPDTITMGNVESRTDKIQGQTVSNKQINLMKATVNGTEKYVYWIESAVGIASDTDYTKDSEITDEGLLYLASYLLSDKYTIVDGSGNAVPEKAKGWIVQSAIWVYQSTVGAANSNLTSAEIQAIMNETSLITMADSTTPIFTSTTPIYSACKLTGSDLTNNTISQIVNDAIKIHNGQLKWNLFDITVNVATDSIISVEDGKYHESDVVTVTPTTQGFLGYKIDLSKAPEGTKIVDTNGNEISGDALDNITEGSQFKIRVPANKVPKENDGNVTIQVIGAFKGDVAYKYVSDGLQSIISVGEITKNVIKGLDNSFNLRVPSEDTGITTAQSLYFVGLIILLAGVGIIYANVRPKKA